jgi:hypothetical protein
MVSIRQLIFDSQASTQSPSRNDQRADLGGCSFTRLNSRLQCKCLARILEEPSHFPGFSRSTPQHLSLEPAESMLSYLVMTVGGLEGWLHGIS